MREGGREQGNTHTTNCFWLLTDSRERLFVLFFAQRIGSDLVWFGCGLDWIGGVYMVFNRDIKSL